MTKTVSTITVLGFLFCGACSTSKGVSQGEGDLATDQGMDWGMLDQGEDEGAQDLPSPEDIEVELDAQLPTDLPVFEDVPAAIDLSDMEPGEDFGEGNDQGSVDDLSNISDASSNSDIGAFVPPVIPTECPDIGLDMTVGPIHYVCDCGPLSDPDCISGNDDHAGISPTAAWRTYDKARTSFPSLPAGETLAFCRGGHFTVENGAQWANQNCTADEKCVVRDYPSFWASGDEERPIISSDGSTFALQDSKHEEGFVFLNLDLRGSGSGSGFFFYNDVDDVLICNVRVDGFHLGIHVAAGNANNTNGDGRNDRIVVRNSDIRNNDGQGWLGGCDDCGVAYSTFVNNGFEKPILNHNIYFSGSNDPAHNMFAIGNDLYQNAIFDGVCSAASLVVHGQKENLFIEGNTLHEDPGAVGAGCWGIAVDSGYPNEESFKNVIIRNNKVVNMGNLSIGVNLCQNCLIENNVVVQTNPVGGWTIRAPSKSENANDTPTTNVTVRNNSIYIGANSGARGVYMSDVGSDHVVVNNAILHASSSNSTCFNLGLPADAYQAVDHNLCHSAGNGTLSWVQGSDLASWSSNTGFDMNSLTANPFYTSLGAMDLSPTANSPMIDAGHPIFYSIEDHFGWPRDDAPDIGAFEYH